jgi:hypothetical protein
MFLASMRKSSLYRMKIYGAVIASLTIPIHAAADSAAIIGGIDLTGTGPAYAALVSSSDDVTPLTLSGDAATGGIISSVSMNSSGNSMIGGQGQTGFPYAALISSSGEITPLIITGTPATHGIIYSTAINSNGNGIIGGRDTTGPIYAALVPPLGNPLTPLVFSNPIASGGIINSVSINDSGNGLIGGQGYYDAQPAYVGSVSASGVLTSLTLTGGVATNGTIHSVAINPSGNGMIGGRDLTGSQPAYAVRVSVSGAVTPLTLTGGISTSGEIFSVVINPSGNGIIGGQDLTGSQPAYTALISSSGTVDALTLTGGMTTNGIINNVAINSAGICIIGGQDLTGSQPAYAALISPSGTVTPLVLGSDMDTNGVIYSVAINDKGNGLIGGWNFIGSQPGYAALVSSSGTVTPLTLTGGITITGWINSVALLPSLLTQIPTTSLSGNNLIFANYINEFSSEDAFYFIPSTLDETLNAALQSAAPTRNGISIYTASYNLFNLTTNFANHMRNQQSERFLQQKKPIAVSENILPFKELSTSLSLQKKTQRNPLLGSPFSIWFETLGALAYQKSQQQTVKFNPTTGGTILAFDYLIMPQLRLGGGVSYLFTHIHEKEDQGHSNIHQEGGFIYSSWDNQQFYVDILVMGGGVQIDQVRNTKMTNFSFHSSSHPNGWQFLPHLEFGFKKNILYQSKTNNFCLNPFVMLDWANAWQESYQEKGDSPFNAAQKAYYGSLLRTEAGLRFYETFFFQSWNFSIQEKISYVNTQSFNAGKINAFLVGSPGSFTVETLSSTQNLGVGQFAISFDPLNACYPTSTLFYQGEFSTQYQSHQANIEFAWQF